MAIVAEGEREKVFLAPSAEIEAVAHSANPTWVPEVPVPITVQATEAEG